MINALSKSMPEPGIKNDLPTNLDGACRAMEQQFMEIILSSMRKAFTQDTSKGSSSFSKEISYSMLDTEVARMSSQGDGMGIWKMMKEQLEPQDGVKTENGSAEKTTGGIVRKMPYILG
jgi:Rod binding domain-containing protein